MSLLVPSTTQEAISRWLSRGDPLTEEILSRCRFSEVRHGAIFIDCPEDLLEGIREASGEFAPLLASIQSVPVSTIFLVCKGVIRNQFNPLIAMNYLSGALPEHVDRLIQAPDCEHPIAVVRMSDHKGLFCTTGLQTHSQAKPNDWLGEDMSKWHIQSELSRLVSKISDHGYLRLFDYDCIDFTGAKRNQVVNAWLTTYKGDACRVVEVVHSTLI